MVTARVSDMGDSGQSGTGFLIPSDSYKLLGSNDSDVGEIMLADA